MVTVKEDNKRTTRGQQEDNKRTTRENSKKREGTMLCVL